MEVPMNSNKIIIIIALITIALVISIPSVYQVQNRHEEKQYNSVVLKITESAKKCVDEDKCHSSKIFLKDLYDKKYLEKTINPKTKEYFDENSYVIKKEGKYELIVA